MQLKGQAQKITIYIGESDKWGHKPLYMAILELLKAEDCAGATVTRALAGFGAHSRIHTANVVALSADLPLKIEWVDHPARIRRVMPRLQEMVTEGLITLEAVEVAFYSQRRLGHLPAAVPVADIMNREVQPVGPNTLLTEAVELLLDKIYRTLPVIDEERRVIGILTEGDLLAKALPLATSVQRQLTVSELGAELAQLRRSGQTVAEIMTRDPVTVGDDTSVTEAVKLMIKHNIKRLPVVDTAARLVGIISRVDILRMLSRPLVAEATVARPVVEKPIYVGEIMITNVPTVRTESRLAEVVELLVSNAQRRVVVVDDQQRVVGLITDGDLIERATDAERAGIIGFLSRRLPLTQTNDFHLNERTAAEVMTDRVMTVSPETPLFVALQRLLDHHIKRLPVINEQGQLVGLIGRGGILRALAGGIAP